MFVVCVIVLGVVVAALFNGGIYQMQKGPENGEWVFRMNRLTGVLSICAVDTGCRVIGQEVQAEPAAVPTGLVPEK